MRYTITMQSETDPTIIDGRTVRLVKFQQRDGTYPTSAHEVTSETYAACYSTSRTDTRGYIGTFLVGDYPKIHSEIDARQKATAWMLTDPGVVETPDGADAVFESQPAPEPLPLVSSYDVNEAGATSLRDAKPMHFGGRYVTAQTHGDTASVFVGLTLHHDGPMPEGIKAGSPDFYAWVREVATAGEANSPKTCETIPVVAKPPFTPAAARADMETRLQDMAESRATAEEIEAERLMSEAEIRRADWTAKRDQLRYDRQIWESGRRHAWCDHEGIKGARDCDHAIATAPYDTYCQADGGQVGICTLSAMPPHADHLTSEGEAFLQTPRQMARMAEELEAISIARASETRAKILAIANDPAINARVAETVERWDTRGLAAALKAQSAAAWMPEHCHDVPPVPGCWCALLRPLPAESLPAEPKSTPEVVKTDGCIAVSGIYACFRDVTTYLACCRAPVCSKHAADTIQGSCPACGSTMTTVLAVYDARVPQAPKSTPAYVERQAHVTFGVFVEYWTDQDDAGSGGAKRAVIGSHATWEEAAHAVEDLKRGGRFEYVHGIIPLYPSLSEF